MGSGIHAKDVPGHPYAQAFAAAYRSGISIRHMARHTGLSHETVRRLIFDEAPWIRQDTARKARAIMDLLPGSTDLSPDEAEAYRTGAWLGDTG